MTARAVPGFFRGLSMPFRGIGFVARNPGLVRIWGIPVLIVLLLILVGCASANQLATIVADRAVPIDQAAEDFERGLRAVGHGIGRFLLFVAFSAASLLLSIVLSPVVAAPFNERISEEVEHREFDLPPPQFSATKMTRDAMRSVRIELVKLSVYLVVVTPLWILGFMFAPAALLSTVLGFIFTAFYFALDYVDAPLTRRSISIRERVRLLTRHPWPMFGFGIGVYVLLLIPLVQLFFMPAAVVGGTRLCAELGLIQRPSVLPSEETPSPASPTA